MAALGDWSGRTNPHSNTSFGLEKPSSPKIALARQASYNGISYRPLPAVRSAIFSGHYQPCKQLVHQCRPCKQFLHQGQPCNSRYLRLSRLHNIQTPRPSPPRGRRPAIHTLVSPWHFGPTYGYLLHLDLAISYMYLQPQNKLYSNSCTWKFCMHPVCNVVSSQKLTVKWTRVNFSVCYQPFSQRADLIGTLGSNSRFRVAAH